MATIEQRPLPDDALLVRYRDAAAGESIAPYTDCFITAHAGPISLGQFVFAFYTTWVFKLERSILRIAVNKPSHDDDAMRVAIGKSDRFAAWTVEDRSECELLMCDFQKRTRSWFRVENAADRRSTTLMFGSAVVPVRNRDSGEQEMGRSFGLLMGFHKLYSRVLLRAAVRRLGGIPDAFLPGDAA